MGALEGEFHGCRLLQTGDNDDYLQNVRVPCEFSMQMYSFSLKMFKKCIFASTGLGVSMSSKQHITLVLVPAVAVFE